MGIQDRNSLLDYREQERVLRVQELLMYAEITFKRFKGNLTHILTIELACDDRGYWQDMLGLPKKSVTVYSKKICRLSRRNCVGVVQTC